MCRKGPSCPAMHVYRSNRTLDDVDITLAGPLVVLALLDSTSFGTLLIPIWLLLNPGRVRLSRMLIYLGTIVTFYFAVGLLILLGAASFSTQIQALLDTRAASWIQLGLGIALFALSFRLDKKKDSNGPGRVSRWRERALGGTSEHSAGGATTTRVESGALLALMGLALGAAALEVATMLPYLAAIGLITTSGLSTPLSALTLAGYCIVMVVPALALVIGRLAARRQIEPLLTKIGNWMSRHAASTTAWVVGIVGFLLARDAAVRLGLLDALADRLNN